MRKGISIGRAYLVTREQYLHVKGREGSYYENEIRLPDIEGIPAYTFTDWRRYPYLAPSEQYCRVILDGLVECGLHPDAAKIYLSSAFEDD